MDFQKKDFMLINKALKVRIYPTQKQEEFFEVNFNCTRFIYNKLLDLSTSYYLENKDITFSLICSIQLMSCNPGS